MTINDSNPIQPTYTPSSVDISTNKNALPKGDNAALQAKINQAADAIQHTETAASNPKAITGKPQKLELDIKIEDLGHRELNVVQEHQMTLSYTNIEDDEILLETEVDTTKKKIEPQSTITHAAIDEGETFTVVEEGKEPEKKISPQYAFTHSLTEEENMTEAELVRNQVLEAQNNMELLPVELGEELQIELVDSGETNEVTVQETTENIRTAKNKRSTAPKPLPPELGPHSDKSAGA